MRSLTIELITRVAPTKPTRMQTGQIWGDLDTKVRCIPKTWATPQTRTWVTY